MIDQELNKKPYISIEDFYKSFGCEYVKPPKATDDGIVCIMTYPDVGYRIYVYSDGRRVVGGIDEEVSDV